MSPLWALFLLCFYWDCWLYIILRAGVDGPWFEFICNVKAISQVCSSPSACSFFQRDHLHLHFQAARFVVMRTAWCAPLLKMLLVVLNLLTFVQLLASWHSSMQQLTIHKTTHKTFQVKILRTTEGLSIYNNKMQGSNGKIQRNRGLKNECFQTLLEENRLKTKLKKHHLEQAFEPP